METHEAAERDWRKGEPERRAARQRKAARPSAPGVPEATTPQVGWRSRLGRRVTRKRQAKPAARELRELEALLRNCTSLKRVTRLADTELDQPKPRRAALRLLLDTSNRLEAGKEERVLSNELTRVLANMEAEDPRGQQPG